MAALFTDRELEADPAAGRGDQLERVGMALAVMAAVAWPLLRQAPGRPWDTVWAEDGKVFLQDVNTMPLQDTLFRGYEGYGLLLPRILVIPGRFLPVAWLAGYVAVSAAVAAALVAVFVYRASASHVPDRWARTALAGACVLSPVLAFENEVTLANLQWVVIFATFWAIVSRQDGGLDLGSRCLVAFLGPSTSPVAGLYLPLVAAVAWTRRRPGDLAVATAFGAGLVVQLGMILATGGAGERAASSAGDFGVLYAVKVLASAALGEVFAADLWLRWGVAFAAVTLVVAALVLAAVLRHVDPARDRTALVALACSFPLFAVPVFIRGSSLNRLAEGVYNHGGSRYFVTPVLLLVSAAAILCATSPRRWLPKALLVQVVVVGVISLGVGADWRMDGPSWVRGVRDAEDVCEATGEATHPIPISPAGAWHSRIPCVRISARIGS